MGITVQVYKFSLEASFFWLGKRLRIIIDLPKKNEYRMIENKQSSLEVVNVRLAE